MPEPVSLAEVLEAHHDARSEGMHTAMPAKVLSFNPLLQTVNVQPQIKRALQDANGDAEFEELPTIDEVPVMFPRGGGFVHTFPLQAGDFVWLIFSETAIGEWRTTGQVSEPQDTRRHSMGYPVAYPGVYPDVQPLLPVTAPLVGSMDPTRMVLGKENGTDRVFIGGGFVQVGDGPLSDFLVKYTGMQAILTAMAAWMTSAVAACGANVPPIVLPPPPPVVLLPTTVAKAV